MNLLCFLAAGEGVADLAITYLRANSALDPDGRYASDNGEEAARAYAAAMAGAFVLESMLVGFLVCLCRSMCSWLGHRAHKGCMCVCVMCVCCVCVCSCILHTPPTLL